MIGGGEPFFGLVYKFQPTASFPSNKATFKYINVLHVLKKPSKFIDHRKIWSLIKAAGNTKDQERYEIVKSVNDLTQLSESKLRKIADCLEEENFQDSACIIKQVNWP